MSKDDLYNLATRVGQGDQEAMALLYRRLRRLLDAYLGRWTKDSDAITDAIHHVCLLVIRACEQKKLEMLGVGYLKTTAKNHLFGIHRKKHPKTGLPSWEFEGDGVDSTRQAIGKRELREQVRRALKRLPRRQRIAVKMRFFKGATYLQISGVLGISERHASRVVRLAYAALRHSLDDYKLK